MPNRRINAKSPPRIGLVVDLVTAYGRAIVKGVTDFTRTHGDWLLEMPPFWMFDRSAYVTEWQVAGLIVQANAEGLSNLLRAQPDLPVVNVSTARPPKPMPCVISDNQAIGRMAAEHFLERGYRSFAYCGYPRVSFSERRREAFEQRVREAGFTCAEPYLATSTEHRTRYRNDLQRWVRSLPRPIAVMTCNDHRAREVIVASWRVGVHVPEDVAVLGVDNDDLIARITNPSLSSVRPDSERVGFEAAALLQRMLSGEHVPPETTLIPPLRVETRQSTDIVAVDDPDVAAAVQFIRHNANRPITVQDVLEAIPVGRRSLERRFRAATGRTLLSAIHRAHLERARQLLMETRLSMPEVAEACGYHSATRFGIAFRRYSGSTPTEYRKQLVHH